MGQKVNPIGLRLGINRGWDSVWFDEKKFSDMVLILDPDSLFMNEHVALSPFVITPTKHYGYALQWFTMSLVLAGMFIYAIKRES